MTNETKSKLLHSIQFTLVPTGLALMSAEHKFIAFLGVMCFFAIAIIGIWREKP